MTRRGIAPMVLLIETNEETNAMINTLPNIDEVKALAARGALFVVNHSGGKDSQAMTVVIRSFVPAEQIVAIHATLPGMEWEGTLSHIEDTTKGLELRVCTAVKTFEQMVERRYESRPDAPSFPSPEYRQCTSDLKRGPIEKEIRAHVKDNALSGLIVNCVGIRGEESSSRAKATTFKLSAKNSKAGREWYEWLPIHDFTIAQVWATIEDAGQVPHRAYGLGASRLSCALCIMSTQKDMRIGARHNPAVAAMLSRLEEKTGYTMLMPKRGEKAQTIKQIIGD